ncbi:MAG TPA: hypothetical protein VGP88_01830 [Thermoplasmata archaeon]|jgi:hypothetical protein|nr:hypothetical protein [Thermoplasmata archaeon]
MWPSPSANPAVARFRRVMSLSLAVRLAVLLVAVYLILAYVGGV